MILPPKPSIFIFKSSLEYRAVSTSLTNATLAPFTLAAELVIPTPVPQITIPKSSTPLTTFSAVALPYIG